eukprot:4235046-Prymnesium_polylepis.1
MPDLHGAHVEKTAVPAADAQRLVNLRLGKASHEMAVLHRHFGHHRLALVALGSRLHLQGMNHALRLGRGLGLLSRFSRRDLRGSEVLLEHHWCGWCCRRCVGAAHQHDRDLRSARELLIEHRAVLQRTLPCSGAHELLTLDRHRSDLGDLLLELFSQHPGSHMQAGEALLSPLDGCRH